MKKYLHCTTIMFSIFFLSHAGNERHPSPPPANNNPWTFEPQQQQQLDLEPISKPKKKRNLLRKLNRTAPGVASAAIGVYGGRSKSNSIDSGSSYKPGSGSTTQSSVESIRDSQVIKAYS